MCSGPLCMPASSYVAQLWSQAEFRLAGKPDACEQRTDWHVGGRADIVLHLCLKKMPSKTTSQGFCFTFPFPLNWQGTLNLSPLLSHSPVLKGTGPTPYLIISFKISFVIAYPQSPFSLILKALRWDSSEVFVPVFSK